MKGDSFRHAEAERGGTLVTFLKLLAKVKGHIFWMELLVLRLKSQRHLILPFFWSELILTKMYDLKRLVHAGNLKQGNIAEDANFSTKITKLII